jgi:hypothetical protein
LTASRRRRYGPRPPVRPAPRLPALALAAALAAACSPSPEPDPAPLDRFTFPISAAVVGDELLVVSANFDLTFGYDDGGSVLPVALAAAPDTTPPGALAGGGVRIPSLGGEIAIADAATCGLPSSVAIVPVRATNSVMLIDIQPDGSLVCGDRCRVPLPTEHADPYGAIAVCRPAENGRQPTARAYVGYLRGPTTAGAISQVDLETGAVVTTPTGSGSPRSFAYDPLTSRLFFTNEGAVVAAPLSWFELAGGCSIDVAEIQGGCPLRTFDLWSWVRGFEPQGLALSNVQAGLARRLYVVGRLFDADVAAAAGGRPSYDVGSALLVIELSESSAGGLTFRLVDTFPLGMGASEVKVLLPTRPADAGRARRDVVAITATGDGVLWLYDDDIGAMAKVFGRANEGDTPGLPVLGRQPYGITVRPLDASTRLFVTSFGENHLSTVDVPLADPGSASVLPNGEIGGAQ